MKTINTLIAVLLMAFTIPIQAQNGQLENQTTGLQAAFDHWVNLGFDGNESLAQTFEEDVRRIFQFGSDIEMWMFVHNENPFVEFFTAPYPDDDELYMQWHETPTDNELYAAFDWQNMAEAMLIQSEESKSGIYVGTEKGIVPRGIPISESEAQTILMFFDNDGYVYTPIETEYGLEGFVKTDRSFINVLQDGMGFGFAFSLDRAIQSGVTEMIDRLFPILGTIPVTPSNRWIKEFLPSDEVEAAYMQNQLNDFSDPVTENLLRDILSQWVEEQFNDIKSVPPLIHFAYLFNPTVIRSKYNVSEDTVMCSVINTPVQYECTKMTIESGDEEGYEFAFDTFNRLVYLKDTDGNYAVYSYINDVSVNIPPATSFNDMIFNYSRYQQ